MNQYDIIGIQESKLDDVDKVTINGYQVFSHNRKALSRYRSGGITLLVKNNIAPFVHIHKFESQLILWFSISKQITLNREELYCGIVYIPPYRSKYAHTDPYLEMQHEIDRFSSLSKNIMLFGDFNSRSANNPDYVKCDDFICDIYGNDDLYHENLDILNCFEMYGIPLERQTADEITNLYGSQLLDFCKSNNVFILNGRIGNDVTSPKLTCKDRSTVDYFISSAYNFSYISSFSILDFNSLYSDAHCPLTLSIHVYDNTMKHKHIVPNSNASPKVRLWDDSRSNLYAENLCQDTLNNITQRVNSMSIRSVTGQEINAIASQIENLFSLTAKQTFGVKTQTYTDHSTNKKWFNKECRSARNKYHYIRKIYNKNKNTYNKNLLKAASKEYKTSISKNMKKYKNERINKLKKVKTSNPKEFWKILNSADKRTSHMPPLKDLYKYFKDLNSNKAEKTVNNEPLHKETENENILRLNQEINIPISSDEIISAVKMLKNNKSPGIDNVLNEHIKSTVQTLLPIYTRLFNIIFDTGVVPESWAVGDILPIYKNKGSVHLPENYRPITLLSCLGKLFTSIINNRLKVYAEKYDIICHNQAGFRKGHSTVDNLFILQSLIEIVKSTKNKLFCAFIDFKQAFDNVWRDGLFCKLQDYDINGKCLNLIKNMYSNIKSRVSTAEGSSAFFPCCTGVRQGENLSPILFSFYLNDLEHYFGINQADGISCEANSNDIYIYLKIFILLFADDTVLFSKSKEDLQHMLNIFENYCENWKLIVNISKTKVLIFTSGRYLQNLHFYFKGIEIQQVTEYKYLGIYLSRSGSYLNCKKHIAEQANTAMFSLLRKIRILNLPIEMQIDLFNKLIKPILLYACEIWGFGNLDIIERVQLKFYKFILNLKKSTPSYMIYGELGVYPLKIDIQTRIISFWEKLLDFNSSKLSTMVYKTIHTLYEQGKCKSNWLNNIKSLVSQNGYGNIWMTHNIVSKKWFQASFKLKLQDQFLQNWNSLVNIKSSGINYRIFKTEFELNKYFLKLTNSQCRILTAFRTGNHRLPIEIGRWNATPLRERICHLCKLDVGDEFHYLLKCDYFKENRNQLIKPYFRNRPNIHKMHQLMNHTNKNILNNLVSFTKIIIKTLVNVPWP
ncbi:MAG: reverse transcriptase family protein [Candidatus Thiodiazotropha sp.]